MGDLFNESRTGATIHAICRIQTPRKDVKEVHRRSPISLASTWHKQRRSRTCDGKLRKATLNMRSCNRRIKRPADQSKGPAHARHFAAMSFAVAPTADSWIAL
jgi:hypothetical protein